MTVDAQIQTIIDGMSASEVAEFSELGHLAVRDMCETMLLPFNAGELSSVEDKKIKISNASNVDNQQTEITIRIYQPIRKNPNDKLPLTVYFHGGGWTIGSLETHDPICRGLAVWGNTVVVSVHYRLAPEHPFPIPLEDCYAATQWVYQNSENLGADKNKLAVAGDSAGGNLATEMCILARDRKSSGHAPEIKYQLLFYPITDANFETDSYRDNAQGYVLRKTDMQWFWDQYIPDPAARGNPNASPLQADLSGLPPATVLTAQYDTLRDEGNAYAEKLKAAGVPAVHKEYPGMIHGFIGFAALVDVGRTALKGAAEQLDRALNQA